MGFNQNSVVNIFVGRKCLSKGIGHFFGSENFERVSSNWGQLISFNKMTINASFEYLIGYFTYNKGLV
jgi:hypothetical protein